MPALAALGVVVAQRIFHAMIGDRAPNDDVAVMTIRAHDGA